MRYFFLALFLTGCATTTEPTMQDAIDIQRERDVAREQQRQLQDYIHAKKIQDIVDKMQVNK